MNLALKELWSPDIDRADAPADPQSFAVFTEVVIGEPGPGGEVFGFMVVSRDRRESVSSFPSLVLDEFSWEAVRKYVEQCLREQGPKASSWKEVYRCLAPFMKYSDAIPGAP